MTMKEIDADVLRQLLLHDAEAGSMTWLHRPLEMFARRQDFLRWNGRFAGYAAFNAPVGQGYLGGRVLGEKMFAHRVIWALHFGSWPEFIDHINGNRADNRIANLRSTTRHENAHNRGQNTGSASPLIGVSWHGASGKWRARATVSGKRVSLGLFKSEAAAAEARDRMLIAVGDQFARLNNAGVSA